MALGLCCCVQAFSSCSKQGLLSCGAQASYCNGFSCCQAWALGCMGFSSYSIWTQFLCSMWYLLGPGIEAATPVPAAQSLDHWTTREVPILPLNEMFKSQIQKIYYTQEKGLQEINSIWRLILWNQFKKKQWFSSFFHCHPYSKGKQILLSESDQTVRTKILSSWFFLEAT